MNKMVILNETSLSEAVERLCQADAQLRFVVERFGPPPLWARKPGFPTLVHIILEQQVSLASAKACFEKLNTVLPDLKPETFLTLDDERLLQIGFSRQKTRYCRLLAAAILDGSLDLHSLNHASDQVVFSQLTSLT
ncbi:MAG: DNA-3-methyladenine glycosylase 2 family protein, partial [Candidatus Marinimicrobia bacterium]|nr:DNA-3-methyladenine glycosylase 2 family protein [Candidatus Neomarinimicrobiota bacterium]